MSSTYSPSLKIELIGNGDQSGTWGNTTNNNLGTLLEQAITGVQSITMVNADYTLSNYNGTSDEARNAVLVVGGTNSAIRKIICPQGQNKLYTVSNQTVGGFAITIGAATGTAVTIPSGIVATVYTDGSNFYSAQTGSAGDFTVNGTLTATGITDTGNLSVGGSFTATSGTVTIGSGAITGTMTAPTQSAGDNSTKLATTAYVATATGSLGTMATQNANAVAITGGTINGVTGTASGLTVGNATNATNVAAGGTIASTVTGTTQPLGTNNTTIATTAFALANGIPSGAIVMWSGSIASIPSGWLLCNGASGTPDLRDRFVVGAGSTYAVAATGGAADAVVVSHTHTLTDPGHFHAFPYASSGNGTYAGSGGGNPSGGSSNTNSAVTGINVNTAGVSGTNANLPPYYALAYIMKA